VVVIVTALLLTVLGAWPALLGKGLAGGAGPVAAGLCLAVFGVNLSVSFGQRILIGLDKNHVATLLLGLQTPVMLVAILIVIALGVPAGNYLAVIAYVVLVLLGGLALWYANRLVRPVIWRAFQGALHPRTIRGGRVFDVGWPLLVQMVAVPLALQTDRILLSHTSTLHQLAIYTLASQLFSPVLGVISSAGAALWPIFAKARARGSDADVTSPNVLALGFGGATAVICLVLALVAPWLAGRASDGSIDLPVSVLLAFSGLMIVQATIYPLGSYLTDAPGLRFQAWMIAVMLPVNLIMSWFLAKAIGAAGPVIGSIISMTVCQLLGTWWYAQRERVRRRDSALAASRGVTPDARSDA
jgi:O-antigen/teichoic acid export membrane protein